VGGGGGSEKQGIWADYVRCGGKKERGKRKKKLSNKKGFNKQ